MKESASFSQLDMFNTFKQVSAPSKSDFEPIERNYKRIHILHKPEIFDEDEIMNLHLFNNQQGIYIKADSKINQYKNDFAKKKMKTANKIKAPIKIRKSIPELFNNETHSLLAKYKDLDVKEMQKYLKSNKGKKKESLHKKLLFNRIDSISNFEFLNLLKLDKKENSVDRFYKEALSYRNECVSPLSAKNTHFTSTYLAETGSFKHSLNLRHNFSDYALESTGNNTETRFNNFGSAKFSNLANTTRENKIPIERSLKVNKSDLKMAQKVEKNKKLSQLISQVNKAKVEKPKVVNYKYTGSNQFQRKEVYDDDLTPDKVKLGMKDYTLSTSKSKHKLGIGNEKKLYGEKTKAYKLIKNCNKMITIHTGIFKANSKSVEKEKKKYENFKTKNKFGKDYKFMSLIKKETANYNKKSGGFIYGDLEGFKYHNIERLYAPKYDRRKSMV